MEYTGLAIPELIVRRIVAAAVNLIRNESNLVESMMAGEPIEDLDSIKTSLLNREEKVRLGFAFEPPEDWEVSIVLESEGQQTATIGNVVSDVVEDSIAEAELDADINAKAGQVLSLVGGVPVGLPERGRVRIGDEVAIYVIIAGDITLTERGIVDTLADYHFAAEVAVFHTISQRIGWSERDSIRVDVSSQNALFALVVGRMLKATLIRSRKAFEDEGLTLHGITATDIAPKPAVLAEFYTRTLKLDVRSEVSLPETYPIVTNVSVELEALPMGSRAPGELPVGENL